jgi:hypothetical protein
MIPAELTLNIWKGCSFDIELVSQFKQYIYDPAIHDSLADHKRSYKENLEFYGFTYQFIDFVTIYDLAELRVYPSWQAKEVAIPEVIFKMTSGQKEIILTDKSIKLHLSAEVTSELKFSQGMYELDLTNIISGKSKVIDRFIFGDINVSGEQVRPPHV